jgi:enoyl-CoA hydratase
MEYKDYQHLEFEQKGNGILLISLNRPDKLNATNKRLHWELTKIWQTIDDDADTRVAVITGKGRAFSAGGDLEIVKENAGNFDAVANVMKEASQIVYNIINMEKPLISAINGVAVGAGLAVALMADISIMAEDARITDGHIRLGVGAGDHAAIIWPILCGMAKAKYYLLTCDFIDGKEADRIGLVSMSCPADQVLPKALEAAEKLALGPQMAIRWTKRAMNNWLRMAGPTFDASLAFEMLNFFDKDVMEGYNALKEKRAPVFPSAPPQ